MAIRFDDIGNRLRAFRLGSGLSADEIADRLGISRTALYRFEKGELAKIETLEKLAELLSVSVPTLLGVGVEYIASAVSYFERMRQIEETCEHIIVLAGPISYLLASDASTGPWATSCARAFRTACPAGQRALDQVDEIIGVLHQRREQYRRRQPGIVNLISAIEMEHFLQNGLVGRLGLPDRIRRERRALARAEAEHFMALMQDEPIGIQVGIVPDTLPHASFQLLRQPDRQVLALSPFRLGEQPNIRVGVAMITSAPEALALHERMARELWQRALKGAAAVELMHSLLQRCQDGTYGYCKSGIVHNLEKILILDTSGVIACMAERWTLLAMADQPFASSPYEVGKSAPAGRGAHSGRGIAVPGGSHTGSTPNTST